MLIFNCSMLSAATARDAADAAVATLAILAAEENIRGDLFQCE